ncbi:MAG: ROK family protein [Bacteroidales bacterium]
MSVKGKLLLDVGGTFIKAGLAVGEDNLLPDSYFKVPIDSAGSSEKIISALLSALSLGRADAESAGVEIVGIGVCIPGPFDYDKGVPLMKHKFASIYGLDLRNEILKSGFSGVSVTFMHDVAAMLSGEMTYGSGASYKNVAIVTLGTGLGFAFSQNRQIRLSSSKSPAVPIYNLPYKDGILEDYASKRGFLRIYSEISHSSFASHFPESHFAAADGSLTVADIGKAASLGDNAALQTFSTVGAILASALREILREKRIECLLFGGQISKSFAFMEPAITTGLSELTDSGLLTHIGKATHIDDAAFYGLCKRLNTL